MLVLGFGGLGLVTGLDRLECRGCGVVSCVDGLPAGDSTVEASCGIYRCEDLRKQLEAVHAATPLLANDEADEIRSQLCTWAASRARQKWQQTIATRASGGGGSSGLGSTAHGLPAAPIPYVNQGTSA